MVRWGFLGAGYVATRAMAPAVHEATGAVLQAVASRDEARSAALEPVSVHHNYRELIDDPDVDAVYISLTNAQHVQWATAALEAGKHVLCEKPLAMNPTEARMMVDAADRADRLLVEASWVRWHPRFARMVSLIESGSIGEVTAIDSSFTFVGDMTGNYRLQPDFGGGALLDVGCYQAQAWVAFTNGARDLTITDVERAMGDTEVDLTTRAHATIDGSIQASMLASFAIPAQQSLEVVGTVANLRTGEGESFTSWREPSSLVIGSHEERFAPANAFVSMVEAVSTRIAGGNAWVLPLSESMRCAEILDAIARHPGDS